MLALTKNTVAFLPTCARGNSYSRSSELSMGLFDLFTCVAGAQSTIPKSTAER